MYTGLSKTECVTTFSVLQYSLLYLDMNIYEDLTFTFWQQFWSKATGVNEEAVNSRRNIHSEYTLQTRAEQIPSASSSGRHFFLQWHPHFQHNDCRYTCSLRIKCIPAILKISAVKLNSQHQYQHHKKLYYPPFFFHTKTKKKRETVRYHTVWSILAKKRRIYFDVLPQTFRGILGKQSREVFILA